MRLWLGSNMPPETVRMARWTLVIASVATTSAGLAQLINAFGKIKWYRIELSVLYLLCLPAGYFLYKNGAQAYTILICFVVADLLNRTIQFILLRAQFRFDVGGFLRHAYLRPVLISLLMTGYLVLYNNVSFSSLWGHVAGFLLTFIVTALLIFLLGIHPEERKKLFAFVRRKLHLT